MTRMSYTIRGDADRQSVSELVRTLKDGMRVEIKQGLRSPEQSNLMWARLNDISAQADWHGQKLEPADWKDMFTAGLRRARVVPNIDGDGFVQLGLHTSDLTKEEMSNLLDLMDAFAAQHGVTFKENHESNSSDAKRNPHSRDLTDTPAADAGPQTAPAAGVSYSFKDPGWFDHYLGFLIAVRDVPASMMTRHQDAIRNSIDEPLNQVQHQIMSSAIRLVKSRNESALRKGEWDERSSDLRRQAEASTRATKGAAA